jgi:hypothetical protein
MPTNNDDALAALAALSLTPATPATTTLRALLADAETLKKSVNLFPANYQPPPSRRSALLSTLETLLRRRQDVFAAHRRVFVGKSKVQSALGDEEAQQLWREVEVVLGSVLERCRVGGVFVGEEMEVLKGACEPGFDWGEGVCEP